MTRNSIIQIACVFLFCLEALPGYCQNSTNDNFIEIILDSNTSITVDKNEFRKCKTFPSDPGFDTVDHLVFRFLFQKCYELSKGNFDVRGSAYTYQMFQYIGSTTIVQNYVPRPPEFISPAHPDYDVSISPFTRLIKSEDSIILDFIMDSSTITIFPKYDSIKIDHFHSASKNASKRIVLDSVIVISDLEKLYMVTLLPGNPTNPHWFRIKYWISDRQGLIRTVEDNFLGDRFIWELSDYYSVRGKLSKNDEYYVSWRMSFNWDTLKWTKYQLK